MIEDDETTESFEVVQVRRVVDPAHTPPASDARRRRRLLPVAVATALLAGGVAVWVRGTTKTVEIAVAEWRGRLPVPDPPTGPLAGLVVYVSAGHGWLLHRKHHDGEAEAWGTQRPRVHGVLEDEWTAEFVMFELAPALEAAGATVIALRERDRNPQRVVVDDGDPGYAANGALRTQPSTMASQGDHQLLAAHGGALWWLEAPQAGHWYLYARWLDDPDHDDRAVYTVTTDDDVREIVVDQRHHGGHWWPIGDFCLPAGAHVEVALTGSGGGLLSADSVRMGGGTTSVWLPYAGTMQTRPSWEMAFVHQLDLLGGPAELGSYSCGAPVSDMRIRGHWASWARPEGEDAVFLSIHTNATRRGRAEGLMVFAGVDSNPRTPADRVSETIAASLEPAIFDAVSAVSPGYQTKGVKLGDFSEISPVHNTVPGALLELGFHDNPSDAARLRDPAFRNAAATGIVDGLTAWRASGS